ncbi:uncharacterized protein LOC134275512, partial [Saccostrea cucullata]|uniref:uncharacterized protein LOC134275512 n=1 Tax=Saccostrea cuccullata TaxID=36930 RepID=UPI002ED3F283
MRTLISFVLWFLLIQLELNRAETCKHVIKSIEPYQVYVCTHRWLGLCGQYSWLWQYRVTYKLKCCPRYGGWNCQKQQMTAREALEYVAYVESHNCTVGTGNYLQLHFDASVWSTYALAAVRTANFLSKLITSNNNTMSALSDNLLYSLVRNNVHLKSVIFGSAIAFEPDISLSYPLYCPYAYKQTNNSTVTVNAMDLSVNYNYTDPETEWYHELRLLDYSNISLVTDQVQH